MFDMSEWNRRAQARREQEQEADDRHHAEHVIPNIRRAFADPAFAMWLVHESARRREGIARKTEARALARARLRASERARRSRERREAGWGA